MVRISQDQGAVGNPRVETMTILDVDREDNESRSRCQAGLCDYSMNRHIASGRYSDGTETAGFTLTQRPQGLLSPRLVVDNNSENYYYEKNYEG